MLKQGKEQFTSAGIIQGQVSEDIYHATQYILEVRHALRIVKQNEFTGEMVVQMSIQVIMILLSQSDTPTHSGLQAVFQENSNNYIAALILSVLLSLRSSGMTYMRTKVEEKVDFVSIPAKILLATRALLVTFTRVSCITAFFAPALGLLNMLAHWQSEQFYFDPRAFPDIKAELNNCSTNWFTYRQWSLKQVFNDCPISNNLPNGNLSFWDKQCHSFRSVPFTSIFRANYEDPSNPIPPTYSTYTMLDLHSYFFMFWGLMILQAILILFVKTKQSKLFANSSWARKIHHAMQSVNMPDCYMDWDVGCGEGTTDQSRQRWWAVMWETISMQILHFVVNVALLVPIMITGRNTFREQH